VTIRWSNQPIPDESGEVVEMLSVGTDVTDITETRKKLERSLQEKEVLLREVHHRVKNNLQVILSMLNLKFGPLLDSEGERQLYDSMGHIYAIAQVHEQLYHTDDFTSVDFQEFLNQVVSYIMNAEKYHELEAELKIDVGEIYLDLDRAIPAGLTVYELVTNSLAHAGFSRGKGRISIEGREEGALIRLVVKDNGPGFDPEWLDSPSTFGFTLIGELITQLNGSIEYRRESGSRFEITFSAERASTVPQNP
jgi:two-component sensor histidine kinase